MHVQREFQREEGAGGFDEVAGLAGQAGQHVVDHRLGGTGGGQVDGLLPVGGVLGQSGGALAGEPGPHGVLEHRAGEGGAPAAADFVGPGISEELVHRAIACG